MKKYLNSVEEVLKALKEGKEVESDNDSCFELVDGWIVETRGNGTKIINSAMFFEDDGYKVYTEEPEPLKFEVNRAYKTRNGDKVFLDSKSQIDGKNILLFVGMKQSAYYFATDIKGKYINAIEHPHDIINYWEEEK